MTLDESTGELSIQTDVRSYAESYLVLIIAHIQIPTDFSNSEQMDLESMHDFELELFVPLELCNLSVLDNTFLNDMVTSILGEPQS